MARDDLDGRSMAEARAALEALAQDRFAFLLTETGFAKGPTERTTSTTAYSYKDRHQVAQIGVQALLDVHEAFVEVSLIRIERGKLPKLGQDERDGRTVRVPLLHLLRDALLVKDVKLNQACELARTKRPWDARLAAALLDATHDLLARYITLVLEQPIDVLFPARGRPR